jgi:hypothetical protein
MMLPIPFQMILIITVVDMAISAMSMTMCGRRYGRRPRRELAMYLMWKGKLSECLRGH